MSEYTTENKPWRLIEFPKTVGRLIICGSFHVGITKWPNVWHRFWYGVLLGWRFEKVADAGEGRATPPT